MAKLPHRVKQGIAIFAALAILGALFALNLSFASPFVRSWDEVDFVLALNRYDLLAMQPHFPGYPYFIAGATIVHQWISDPVRSLNVFNALFALSAALPIALLAKRYVGTIAAWWAPVWVLTTPYLWLMGSRPMSECAGIAALWWYVWSVREAADKPNSFLRHGVAILMFSLLMGIRLSFFPFGAALVLLWVVQYRSLAGNAARRWIRLMLSLIAAGAAQLVWVGGLVMSEGTLQGFWKLSQAFVAGHFSEWGGGVVAAEMPFGSRVVTLLADHLFYTVLFSRSAVIGALLVFLVAIVCLGARMLRGGLPVGRTEQKSPRYGMWLGICIAAYAVWALLGQNIEKPRHIAPIAGPLLLLLYVMSLRTILSLRKAAVTSLRNWLYRAVGIGAGLAMTAVLIAQFTQGVSLLKLQAEQKPAVYRLHEYIESLEQPLVLYTWEETRVLQYLHADYEHRRIWTFDYFHALADSASDRRVLLTDHVLGGFMLQNDEAETYVTPVATFRSEALFDPVYSEITLYEWRRNDSIAK